MRYAAYETLESTGLQGWPVRILPPVEQIDKAHLKTTPRRSLPGTQSMYAHPAFCTRLKPDEEHMLQSNAVVSSVADRVRPTQDLKA
jgi:hypothetical protein